MPLEETAVLGSHEEATNALDYTTGTPVKHRKQKLNILLREFQQDISS